HIAAAFDGVGAKAEDTSQLIDGALGQSAAQTVAATDAMGGNVSAQMQKGVSETTGQVAKQRESISTQLGTLAGQANDAGTSTVSRVGTNLDAKLGEVDRRFDTSLAQYRGQLDLQVTGADSKAQEPVGSLTNRIDQAQIRAEERAKKGFF